MIVQITQRLSGGKEMWELAYKPGSVEDNHSSTIFVAKYLKRPTQIPPRVTEYGFLFGLAPSGVYTATKRYRLCGALLPHHFTLT